MPPPVAAPAVARQEGAVLGKPVPTPTNGAIDLTLKSNLVCCPNGSDERALVSLNGVVKQYSHSGSTRICGILTVFHTEPAKSPMLGGNLLTSSVLGLDRVDCFVQKDPFGAKFPGFCMIWLCNKAPWRSGYHDASNDSALPDPRTPDEDSWRSLEERVVGASWSALARKLVLRLPLCLLISLTPFGLLMAKF
jgi:hypothetical protein